VGNKGKDQERQNQKCTHQRRGEELRLEDVQNKTEGNRLQWFRNVKRMDEHRIPKRVLERKVS
jgi:hypothetical protein